MSLNCILFFASKIFAAQITKNYKNLNSLCRFLEKKLGYENVGFFVDENGGYVFTTTSEKIRSTDFVGFCSTKKAKLLAINPKLSGKEVYAFCVFLEKTLELKLDYCIQFNKSNNFGWVLYITDAEKNYTLDPEEQEILDAFEAGEFHSILTSERKQFIENSAGLETISQEIPEDYIAEGSAV